MKKAEVLVACVAGAVARLSLAAPAPVDLDRHAVLAEYRDFLTIPNVAADAAGLRRTADALVAMLERQGLAPRLLTASNAQAPAAVYGEWLVAGAQRTVVFYAHYDGQPVDPAAWTDPPFAPVLRTGALLAGAEQRAFPTAAEPIDPAWRLYARSASDDKAGCFALVQALGALRREGKTPSVNVKLFFDGEEEAGSPHLADLLARHRDLLRSDAWIIVDGPVYPDGRKEVVFGVRGDVNVHLTVYGATRPLHSGHYGNWSPNPAMRLAQLLASMKDAAGRVSIAGWYDDVVPLSAGERAAIAAVGADDAALRAELGLAQSENAGRSLLELINEPSLNVNGLRSADVGALARNVIPITATATLDLRVVKDVSHRRQIERLVRHLEGQGYFVLDRAPAAAERARHALIATVVAGSGYYAARTPMDTPLAKAVLAAVQSTSERRVVALPTSGGSLPLVVIERALAVPTLSVPIVNHDNNQHAEDENLRLGNLFDGIETLRALMQMSPEW